MRPYQPPGADGDPLTGDPNATWCPGTYEGAVEWREPGDGSSRRRRLPSGIVVFGRLVGTYAFEVGGE